MTYLLKNHVLNHATTMNDIKTTIATNGIMHQLKKSTQSLHDRIETLAHVNKIMDGSLTLEEYTRLIKVNYIFHWGLETLITEHLKEEDLMAIQFRGRRKIGYLYSDLTELGAFHNKSSSTSVLVEAVNQKPDIKIESVSHALGMMYVAEGATLGGVIIKRELSKNYKIAHKVAFHYYGCYGAAQGRMWKQFKDMVTMHVKTEQQQVDALIGAKQAFGFLADLFDTFIE